jgi:hypothetical protein
MRGAIEGNAADDALMVDQGTFRSVGMDPLLFTRGLLPAMAIFLISSGLRIFCVTIILPSDGSCCNVAGEILGKEEERWEEGAQSLDGF